MERLRITIRYLALLVVVVFGGCMQAARNTEPPLCVPFAVGSAQRPVQYASGTANHILPMPGEEYLEIGRDERGYYGSIMLDSYSAYTEFTSDAQPIGSPREAAYRYHYVYKTGVSVP
jgi:hypothetical protein